MCSPNMPNRSRNDRDEPEQQVYEVEMDEQQLDDDATEYDSDEEMEYETYVVDGHKYVAYLDEFSDRWQEVCEAFHRAKAELNVPETAPWVREYLMHVFLMFDTESLYDLNEGLVCVHPACQRSMTRLAVDLTRLLSSPCQARLCLALYLLMMVARAYLPADHRHAEPLPEMLATLHRALQQHVGNLSLMPPYLRSILEHGHVPLQLFGRAGPSGSY